MEHLDTLVVEPGEAQLLRETAEIVAQLLLANSYNMGENQLALSEHLLSTFNTYSGVAHGCCWPRLVPGTKSLVGFFTAELWLAVSTTQLSVDRLERAHVERSDGAGSRRS
jgi:hydrogenase/urease accessory protein HupE